MLRDLCLWIMAQKCKLPVFPASQAHMELKLASVVGVEALLRQGRSGTARTGGPGDLWHGPARKIMARKNIGTARHGKSWHGKILARHGTKNQTHFLWVKTIFRNLVPFFMGEKYFQEFGPISFMGEKIFSGIWSKI